MEILKLNVGIEEKKLETPKQDLNGEHNGLNNELIKDISIKGLDINFKDRLEERSGFLLTLQPWDLSNYLEKEYAKVKDFDFSRIDIKDIKNHIKNL